MNWHAAGGLIYIVFFFIIGIAFLVRSARQGWREGKTGEKSVPILLPALRGKISLWIQARMMRGAEGWRVFQNELGEWPEVYTLQSGNGYVMKARYAAPDRAVWTGRLPFLTGIAAAVAIISWAVADNLLGVVVGGLAAGFISVPIWRSVLEKSLKMTVSQSEMFWRTPEGRSATVTSQGDFEIRVQLPHRLAQEEIRVHQNYLRRRPATKNAPKGVYQVASEVIIHTGVGKREWLTVASIANDESGEKAHKLLTAIEFVANAVRAEARGKTDHPVTSLPAVSLGPPTERYE